MFTLLVLLYGLSVFSVVEKNKNEQQKKYIYEGSALEEKSVIVTPSMRIS